jgi:hypothetical protein
MLHLSAATIVRGELAIADFASAELQTFVPPIKLPYPEEVLKSVRMEFLKFFVDIEG